MTHPANGRHNLAHIMSQSLDQEKPTLMVFDVDSTLFDVSQRTTEIIRDFSKSTWNRIRFSSLCKKLANFEATSHDWGYIESLRRHRVEISDRQAATLHQFWHQRFFSNDYLGHDIPYPGAIEFVNQWIENGNHIIYLTGRHTDRMHSGTVKVFNECNLPINDSTAILKLKNEKSVPDEDFKLQYLLNLDAEKYTKIWFVENEPVNLNIVERHAPHVGLIYFDSVHSGRAQVTDTAIKIKDFPQHSKDS